MYKILFIPDDYSHDENEINFTFNINSIITFNSINDLTLENNINLLIMSLTNFIQYRDLYIIPYIEKQNLISYDIPKIDDFNNELYKKTGIFCNKFKLILINNKSSYTDVINEVNKYVINTININDMIKLYQEQKLLYNTYYIFLDKSIINELLMFWNISNTYNYAIYKRAFLTIYNKIMKKLDKVNTKDDIWVEEGFKGYIDFTTFIILLWNIFFKLQISNKQKKNIIIEIYTNIKEYNTILCL